MASIGNGKPDAQGQERQAARLLPPAEVPPPHTDAGLVVLFDLLRRRVDGFPTWMLPAYLVHGVDVYGHHPQDLLRRHPPATSPDGKRASYFVNLVRPLTATDARRSRVVPGGFWKSERAPVPVEAAPDKMIGTKQAFSFISKEAEHKGGPRGGFIMHELLLPGQAGRLAGGDELALSKVYPSPRVATKKRSRSQGQGPTASATRTAAASSAPAPTSSPPLLQRSCDVFSSARSSSAVSSPPPSLEPPASSAPPSLEASSLGPASSAPGPASSSPPPIQGSASSPRHRQGAAKRVLLLEVGDSPPREGHNISCHQVYRAMEVLGPGRHVPIDCADLFLLDSGKGKRQRTAAEF
ncbi:uncharacterized protein LOC119336868 [Triticum dicoccoides]|uniref:uncharacterized protein LOC119336868 n=1 Tax=Triticum dicoccoides TaxID=85692 RepID=UPI000E7A0E25|nr:uncharacterized protein LOC119336868 [Triticum dicoccoides]XP_037464844.1 uncharacterized protein LOC119336868 [Triticum dicoccoides]XP_037464845.1 uncharacterized protein LOC119336868 [Triticum dicoccoides]XP_037464846.1 uncharacterized protein LOC119336868 [Triticum dicoccoides]